MTKTIDRIFQDTYPRLGIAAPSSPLPVRKMTDGVRAVETLGGECVFGEGLLFPASLPWLAAPDVARAACLNSMIRDGSVDAVLALRGGSGAGRILNRIDWDALAARPDLPVIGYSDITAIHCAMTARHAGIPIAGRMLGEYSEILDRPAVLKNLRHALETAKNGKKNLKRRNTLRMLKYGSAEGPLIPVNLSVFTSLCGTTYFPDMNGTILVVEDVGELPRRIDRMLTQLRLCGVFDRIRGLVFGEFTDCGKPSELRELKKVWADSLSVPVFEGLPFGHTENSLSFVWGEEFRIEEDGGCFY